MIVLHWYALTLFKGRGTRKVLSLLAKSTQSMKEKIRWQKSGLTRDANSR